MTSDQRRSSRLCVDDDAKGEPPLGGNGRVQVVGRARVVGKRRDATRQRFPNARDEPNFAVRFSWLSNVRFRFLSPESCHSAFGRCCRKSRKSNDAKNLANGDFWTSPPLRCSVVPLGRSVVVFRYAMWSLTSLRTKRVRSFRKFCLLPPKNFFDSIHQLRTFGRGCRRSDLGSQAAKPAGYQASDFDHWRDVTPTCCTAPSPQYSQVHILTIPSGRSIFVLRSTMPLRFFIGLNSPSCFQSRTRQKWQDESRELQKQVAARKAPRTRSRLSPRMQLQRRPIAWAVSIVSSNGYARTPATNVSSGVKFIPSCCPCRWPVILPRLLYPS